MIGIAAAVTRRPLPPHRANGFVHGGSSRLCQPSSNNEGSPSYLKYVIGKPGRESLRLREIPRAKRAAIGVACQPWTYHSSDTAALPWRGVIQWSCNRTERVSLGSPFSSDRGPPQPTKALGIRWTLSLLVAPPLPSITGRENSECA